MAQDFLPPPDEASPPASPDLQERGRDRKRIKHLLIGDPALVRSTIHSLHTLGYSEVREWSKPVSAGSLGDRGEVVSVLLRSIMF